MSQFRSSEQIYSITGKYQNLKQMNPSIKMDQVEHESLDSYLQNVTNDAIHQKVITEVVDVDVVMA